MAAHHCRISQAAAIAICDALVDLLDAGTPPGNLIIYTGTEPANCNASAGTEVATCVLDDTAAYAAASYNSGTGCAEAELTATATCASATGNASAVTYFRLCNAAGTAVLQGTCSATSGDDLVLTGAVIVAAAEVNVTSMVVAVPINQA
ncbi:MAG: hypothetical protein ABFE13_12070 [Phycisphaerales bacterium]